MDFIRRADLRAHPDWLFVFGDNFARAGHGGQAKECRGEPNAVGIPTKRLPGTQEAAYLTSNDIAAWKNHAGPNLARIHSALAYELTVVFPSAGIGTGLAQLERRAPAIWTELELWLDMIKAGYYDPTHDAKPPMVPAQPI